MIVAKKPVIYSMVVGFGAAGFLDNNDISILISSALMYGRTRHASVALQFIARR